MITKIYELTRLSSAFISTSYCGIQVDCAFVYGRGSSGANRAAFVTSDRFTQDALEKDPRFGKMYVLTQTIKDEEELAKEAANGVVAEKEDVDDSIPTIEMDASPKPKKKVAPKKRTDADAEANVRTINDAYDYFAAKGIVIDDDEQLEQTMRELNVSFPNLEK